MDSIFNSLISAISWLFSNIIYINILLAILIVFFQRREPQAVWTWLLVLMALPIVGFILYIIIGQDFHKRNMFNTKEISDMVSGNILKQQESVRKYDLSAIDSKYMNMVMYNLESSEAPYTSDNEVEIFDDGIKKMEALCEELKKAKEFIHIQYYIIHDDEAFEMLASILKEKAKSGVEIRVLYDDVGCRATKNRFWKQLASYGIKTGVFFPAYLKRFQFRANYRNHRKIVIIDNKVGFVGGFNIGREYLSMDEKIGYWADMHLKIEGSAVNGLENRFILDWSYAAKENLVANPKYSLSVDNMVNKGKIGMQIISSGPDSKYMNIRNNYLMLIHKAKHHICIQSPYFVPDEAILGALKIAVLSGVEVNIVIPCKPDHMFVYWVTYSYIGELVRAGAKCYTYNDGFIHGKYVTADGEACCVGTANMDIRSFKLNFEVNAVIYDKALTRKIENSFSKVVENSTIVTEYDYATRGIVVKFKEQLCRLLSPIL